MKWIALIFLVILFALSFAFEAHLELHPNEMLLSPSLAHWMGTDNLGRDLGVRCLMGMHSSLAVALLSALLSNLIGLVYGGCAGLAYPWVGRVLMKAIDVAMAIPHLALMILMSVFAQQLGVPSLSALVIALVVTCWMPVARVVRAQVLQLKKTKFIEAAQAIGATRKRIFVRHLAPHLVGPVLALFIYQTASNILFESFLSFIGLGVQAPQTSWGGLLAEGWASLRYYPHLVLFPAGLLVLSTITLNAVSDSVSDHFNVKLREL